jgi:hypothetical protein
MITEERALVNDWSGIGGTVSNPLNTWCAGV